MVDDGYGVGTLKNGVYLDFKTAIDRLGRNVIEQRYGNLFDMYDNISGEDPYTQPMRIYPAVHYTMGGLWVDYNLMSNIPGLFVMGEANFSDHGANRLGASALMQGLADGYFVLPTTIAGELANHLNQPAPSTESAAFNEAEAGVREQINKLLTTNGKRSVDSFHKELGHLCWDYCGMARNKAGLETAIKDIGALARRVLVRRSCAGRRRVVQPVAGESRARGGLHRTRAVDVPGRAASRGILRRPLPRGTPDAGRRSATRRRQVRLRGGLGVHGRRARRRTCTRKNSSSKTSTLPRGATNEPQPPPQGLAAVRPERRRAVRDLHAQRHQRGHVVPRNARRGQRRA